jgi:hypothetical protein
VLRAQLVITAITTQGLTQAEAARTYGLSEAWVSRLMARYRDEGEAAYTPRSRRPNTSPNALAPDVVDLIVRLRKELTEDGLNRCMAAFHSGGVRSRSSSRASAVSTPGKAFHWG